jgi:hypothetical protein
MKILTVLPALIVLLAQGSELSGIEDILYRNNCFQFTDGSSTYSFFSDGSFLLEPVGLSGRAVEGVWETEDYCVFNITGTWTWYNGISAIDDFRQMTICITLLSDAPDTLESLWQGTDTPVYNVYFTIDEVVPLETIPEQ